VVEVPAEIPLSGPGGPERHTVVICAPCFLERRAALAAAEKPGD
jgi:hypothetical protein